MKKFLKNNQSFTCEVCGKFVEKHSTSSRDHCNHCLFGKHVDINPGDRLNPCQGILEPVGILIKSKSKKIVYNCKSCNKQIFNIVAVDDNDVELLKLSSKIW